MPKHLNFKRNIKFDIPIEQLETRIDQNHFKIEKHKSLDCRKYVPEEEEQATTNFRAVLLCLLG